LLVGESDAGPVGVLRYDFEETIATVSVYLDPAQHDRGYGPSLLASGELWLQQSRPSVTRLRAEIALDNHGSHSAFAEAGFHPRGLLFEKMVKAQMADA
jgi:RimJ/RimL family protein N-acetyltransferase